MMNKSYLTVVRNALTLVLLCGFAVHVQAFRITATESRYEPGGVRYYFTVSNWSTSDSGRHPCVRDDPGVKTCNISLGVLVRPSASGTVGRGYFWEFPIRRQPSSLGDLLVDLMKAGFSMPFNGSIFVPTESITPDLCIGFSAAMSGPNLGGMYGVFGSCARVIAPALKCDISGDTNIDHGRLADNALQGKRSQTQLSLRCTGPTSVRVSTSKTDSEGVRLRSDGSLFSKITVNGRDVSGGSGDEFPVYQDRPTQLDIVSTLVTRGTVSLGKFSGSTIITVNQP